MAFGVAPCMVCPLTGEPMALRLVLPADWRRPEPPHDYRLYWSNASQYGELCPRPTPDEIQASYRIPNYYTRGEAAERLNQTPPLENLLTRLRIGISWRRDRGTYIDQTWIARQCGDRPRRVLDIGCGNGTILAAFKEAGHEVLGIEPDEAARTVAQSHGLPVVDGTAERLPPAVAGREFDFVVMTHVLEHTLEPLTAVRNAASLLADGGTLILETPNNAAIGMLQAGSTWRWLDVPRHLNFFTPVSLKLICRQAGLLPLAVEYRGYTRQFLPEWIREEQEIWDTFHNARGAWQPVPPRNSTWRSWLLLLRTLWAPGEKKYDSVRVLAQKER